jgi:hypothetical protein
MKKSRFILSMLVLPMVALAQLESDTLEAAKLSLFEKMYEKTADHYLVLLEARGLFGEEAEGVLFEAIDVHAVCVVLAAQAQAHEQGLSEEIILKGLGGKTRGKEESLILLQLDMEQFKLKTKPCNDALGQKLGVPVV